MYIYQTNHYKPLFPNRVPKNSVMVQKWALSHQNIHGQYETYIPTSILVVLDDYHGNKLQHFPTY